MKSLSLVFSTLAILLVASCTFYPAMPQADVDARHTAQAETLLPTVTLAPAEATATEVVIAATLEATPVPECVLKGNISSRGEKILHSPGDVSYDRTVIDPEHGEKFFCSVEEAVAEGWREAKR